jgi:hypothetical protein
MRYCMAAGLTAIVLAACVDAPQRGAPPIYNDKDVPEFLPVTRSIDEIAGYPDELLRRRRVGNVTLVYSVSANGRAVNIRAVGESSAEFVPVAIRLLQSTCCSIPRNWAESGGPMLRRQLRIIYNLTCMPKMESPRSSEVVVITATCLR